MKTRGAAIADATAIARIYNEGIDDALRMLTRRREDAKREE